MVLLYFYKILFIYNIYFCTYCYSILQWQQVCWWCELHVALSIGGSCFKSASDLFILSSPTRGTHAGKRALETQFVSYSSSFFMICVCEWGGVQMCNCLQ